MDWYKAEVNAGRPHRRLLQLSRKGVTLASPRVGVVEMREGDGGGGFGEGQDLRRGRERCQACFSGFLLTRVGGWGCHPLT